MSVTDEDRSRTGIRAPASLRRGGGGWLVPLAFVLGTALTVTLCLTVDSAWAAGAPAVLVGLTVLFAALVVVGARAGGLLGALTIAQAVYWIISFVLRPLLLLVVQPRVRTDDAIADSRLAHFGYAHNLASVLGIVLGGLAVYVLTVAVAARFAGRWRVVASTSRFDAVFLLAVGWALRLASVVLPPSTLLNTLSGLGTVGVGCVVLLTRAPLTKGLLALLVASELAWSALAEIKTPILALGLWLAIRTFTNGGHVPVRKALQLGVGGFAAFSVIQNVKVSAGLVTGTADTALYYPWWARPLLPIITRFDLLSAATDASFAGPRTWLTPAQATVRFVKSFVPQQVLPGAKSENLGLLWNLEVKSISLPSKIDTVFLAQGPTAEGWVIGGWAGVVAECALVALVVVLVARCLGSRSVPLALFGITMTSQPYLFERGMLAIGEGAGKALQVTVLSTAVLATAALVRRRRRPAEPDPATATATATAMATGSVPA